MRPRLELQAFLLTICQNVYFQPPASIHMDYPCIVYSLSRIEPKYADNAHYSLYKKYDLQYITRDPDDPVIFELANLSMCSFDRAYKADNLNHYAYSLYF